MSTSIRSEMCDERLTMIMRAYRDQWYYIVEGTYWDTIWARKKREENVSSQPAKEQQEVDKMANQWMDMNKCQRCKENIDFGNRSNFCEICLLTVEIELDEFTGFSCYFKNN